MIHTDGTPTIASAGTRWHDAAERVLPRTYHAVIHLPCPSEGDDYLNPDAIFAAGCGLLDSHEDAEALAWRRNADPDYSQGARWIAVTWQAPS